MAVATKTKKKTAIIQVRVDEQDKIALEKFLSYLGLTTSQAILIYFKQILLKKKIPLDLSLDGYLEEISQEDFRKIQANLVARLDVGETIPEFHENNARPFVV